MNRLLHRLHPGHSADALRLWGLMAVLATVSQLNEALVDASMRQQILYWSVRFVVLSVSLFAAQWVVDVKLRGRWTSPVWIRPVVLVSSLALVPFTVVELLLESTLPMVPAYDDAELMSTSPLLAYGAEIATNATIVMPLHFLVWLLIDRRTTSSIPTDLPAESAEPDFLQKTHGVRAKDLLALKAEEHYVLVHTLSGNELIHHRFGSAIAQLSDELGLQVHRSWWVAVDQVVESKRGVRRWQLVLKNGIEVPVSDGYVKSVRARGLLKRKVKRKTL